MKGFIRCACMMGVLSLAQFCAAGDWKQYRGPHGDGTSADTAINVNWKAKPPRLLWSLPLGDDGWSNPSVGDGRVFVLDHENGDKGTDVVRALDLNTGRVLWSTPLPWTGPNKYGFTAPSPALDEGQLFVVTRGMKVACLEAASGKMLWQRDADKDFSAKPAEPAWGHAASPLVDSRQVILIPGGPEAAVVALDRKTGATRWKAPGGPAGYASPVFYGEGAERQVVVLNSEGLIGFSPEDGKRLWTYPRPVSHNQNSATPIAVGKRIFVTSAWNVGSALIDITGNKPTEVWNTKELQARFSSPVYIKGQIYGVSQPQTPGTLVCLDAETGKVNWKQPGFEFGPLSAVGDTLVALNGKTGEVVLIKANPAAYQELARLAVDAPSRAWNSPIVTDGKLLARNQKTLLCLDVAP